MHCVVLVSFVLALWVQIAYGIYEDQAGDLDWSVENVGRVIAVAYGGNDKRAHSSAVRGTARAAYIASDERSRAIARIDSKTGTIKWRRVLYEGDSINTIQLTNYGLLSVSQEGQNVRLWDVGDGSMLWDTLIETTSYGKVIPIEEERVLLLSLQSASLVRLKDGVVLWRSNLPSTLSSVTSSYVSMDATNVLALGQTSSKTVLFSIEIETGVVKTIPVDADTHAVGLQTNENGHVALVTITSSILTIQSLEDRTKKSTLSITDLSLAKNQRFQSILSPFKHSLIVELESKERLVFRVTSLFQAELMKMIEKDGIVMESSTDDGILFHLTTTASHIQIQSLTTPSQQWQAEVDVSRHGGDIAFAFAGCSTRIKDSNVPRCRVLLVMKDDGLIMSSTEDDSNILWIRQEALANIQDVVWITPAETLMEKQVLKTIPSFSEELSLEFERLQQFVSQFSRLFLDQQIQSELTSVSMTATHRQEPANAHFFGFSKYLVILTQSGRLFAIRAETNEIVWSTFMGLDYRLLVTRDHPALGNGAELLLVSPTGRLVWIDGDTGLEIEKNNGQDNAWVILLPKRKLHVNEDVNVRRSIALVSKQTLKVQMIPSGSNVDHFYFYTLEQGVFQGYTIENTQARMVWSVVIPTNQRLVAHTRPREHAVIDSSVTITGDDSLLLKYLNPHLFGMATIGDEVLEGENAPVLYLSLIDAVSGRMVHRVRHVYGMEPVEMIQHENWLVYSFWNRKEKRTELVSLSLFDGAIGTHSLNLWKRPTWNEYRSSYDPKAPFVLQKSYIFPTKIKTLGCTVTARGITPSSILVGMETGQIFSLSRTLIDPRQPEKPPTADEQNEGLIEYTPIIPLYNSLTSMVTYNKTIANLHTISTTFAELESTTLVFAYGLDLFYVRFAPAKAFDVLPLDFNYQLLVLLCLGFVGATMMTKTLAQRKALNEAWK